ncbi:MAG: heme A synthase [Bacteroidetes bacterium]|nr:MAG: heme A synthase [Bacteroidota bacterium]
MTFNKWYIRLNWTALVLIYLVVIAGSFVRITGSGMGCPDWPKCFGQWVPPTEASALPDDYKEVYSAGREKKILKFASLLEKIGFKAEAEQLRRDKSLLIEQDFNARKTWTEYVNRLFGFLAGNAVLLVFLWTLFRYRRNKLVFLSLLNLVVLGLEAWFGSIVVATNLVPWTITVHMFLALLIIALQLLIISIITREGRQSELKLSPTMKWIIWISFLITLGQMFLGAQVREYIDELTMSGYGRESWTEKLGLSFWIHRSFSWLVLVILTWLAWLNYKGSRSRLIYLSYLMLVLELIGGVLLAYADMPGLVQTSHLLFASILFGSLFYTILRLRTKGGEIHA